MSVISFRQSFHIDQRVWAKSAKLTRTIPSLRTGMGTEGGEVAWAG